MSIERHARRSLWRMVCWRLLGELLSLPRIFLSGIALILESVAQFFGRVELAVFSLELDAARRYKLLTGVDMGMAMNQPGRYGLINNPDFADQMQNELMGQAREEELE